LIELFEIIGLERIRNDDRPVEGEAQQPRPDRVPRVTDLAR